MKKQTEKPWKEIEKETKHFCQTWKKKLKNKTKQTDIEKKTTHKEKSFTICYMNIKYVCKMLLFWCAS